MERLNTSIHPLKTKQKLLDQERLDQEREKLETTIIETPDTTCVTNNSDKQTLALSIETPETSDEEVIEKSSDVLNKNPVKNSVQPEETKIQDDSPSTSTEISKLLVEIISEIKTLSGSNRNQK